MRRSSWVTGGSGEGSLAMGRTGDCGRPWRRAGKSRAAESGSGGELRRRGGKGSSVEVGRVGIQAPRNREMQAAAHGGLSGDAGVAQRLET